MKAVVENIAIYISLVFRPSRLVRIAREYLEAAQKLKELNVIAREIKSNLQNHSCKQGK